MRFAFFFVGLMTLTAGVFLTAQTQTAFAQETDAQAQRADALIREGVQLRKNGRERDALDRFREAHATHPSPHALGQIGLASKSLRLYVESERALIEALANTNDTWVQENKAALRLALDVVAKQLASLNVTANTSGADLFVNGSFLATLPLERPARVLAGIAHIELRAVGYEVSQTDVKLPAGETTELQIDLARLAEPAPPPPPPLVPPPPAADARGSAPSHEPTLPRRPSTARRVTFWSALGISAVGIGIGSVFGAKTLMNKSDRDKLCDDRTCQSDEGFQLDADARSAAQISTIGFAVGVVALATAGVLLLTEPRR